MHNKELGFALKSTHPFNGPLSGTTQVSRYQKGKTNLDFTEARDNEWQWYQLGMCKSAPRSRQITTPAPHHSVFFTGRMPFLSPNQQRQSTEGRQYTKINSLHITITTSTMFTTTFTVSRTTWVSQYQKGKTSPDLNEARDNGVW